MKLYFLGGNGHCQARLEPARTALSAMDKQASFELVSVPYPGFEARPRAADFSTFLDSVEEITKPQPGSKSVIYATGIGGLLALTLRSRGRLIDQPIILQAPVLWGLELRLFPKLLRFPGFSKIAFGLFRRRFFQKRFCRKYFTKPPPQALEQAFFRGYQDCRAFSDFFDWLNPALLRALEQAFQDRPSLLDKIEFWWGDQDRVVGIKELRLTEERLERRFPLQTFPEWGHYPMIDAPESWIRRLLDALETLE